MPTNFLIRLCLQCASLDFIFVPRWQVPDPSSAGAVAVVVAAASAVAVAAVAEQLAAVLVTSSEK